MRYLSVCSGIEAATVAWHGLGWQPVGFSEIEKFPSQVLAHHYPGVSNLGDMTNYKEWNIGAIDLLVGGTPCQSFSVAGLRKGLEDPRGNLALVYCGILDHFRPQWCVWENVPGVLSSNGGRDFGSFLGALAELGYGFAYRVLDAQYFGVAQRRRRVFVIGYLGDWRPAAKVLFEPESLRRDSAPSREKRQDPAKSLMASPSQRLDPTLETMIPTGVPEVMSTLLSSTAGISRVGNAATEHETYIPMAQPMCFQQNTKDKVRYIGGDGQIAGALAAQAGMKQQNYLAQPISIHPHCIGRSPEAGPQGKEYLLDGSAYCMDSRGQPQAVMQPIAFHATQDPINGPISPALGSNMYAGVAQPVGAFKSGQGAQSRSIGWDENIAPTLPSNAGGNTAPALLYNMAVRRLTPVECERLQGFPDNYTAIPWRGKADTPDGPRYKALGNSMAVPVMKWIGKRIEVIK